ncbi:hypothetical protein QUA30_15825 [Microcoleus sp. Pol14C2]|uniref:hypothetical protein n=1 Tax=unclassified Microcoleus TaxID=2642155 RepID=UPI002FD44153
MVGEETCVPSQGVGENGIASEFGDLTGMTRQEVDDFLRGLGAKVKSSLGNYVEYKFSDRSKVIIRTNSEVVRLPAPRYGSDGRRINWGLRLGKDGSVLQTRDEFGNQIPDTHITGEKVSN